MNAIYIKIYECVIVLYIFKIAQQTRKAYRVEDTLFATPTDACGCLGMLSMGYIGEKYYTIFAFEIFESSLQLLLGCQ